MALKYIHQDDSNQSREMLPLLRDFCKNQLKEGKDPYGESFVIHCITTSKSEEWVILSTLVFSCLVHTDSVLGRRLTDLIVELSGEGNALVIIPEKKGKLGFSIAIDDEIRVYYSFNKGEGATPPYLWVSNKNKEAIEKSKTTEKDCLPLSEILSSPKASVDNLNNSNGENLLTKHSEKNPQKKASTRQQKSVLNGSNPS